MNQTTAKKKLKKRTKFTLFAMFNLFWYTLVVINASYQGVTIPSELTYAWFAAWTVELALLFGIKVRSKDATDDGGEDYKIIEAEDKAIEKENARIDAMKEEQKKQEETPVILAEEPVSPSDEVSDTIIEGQMEIELEEEKPSEEITKEDKADPMYAIVPQDENTVPDFDNEVG